jgi:imidazolonepropionase-like amidohydrolase
VKCTWLQCSRAFCSLMIRLSRKDFRIAPKISCVAAFALWCISAAAQDVRIEHVTVVSPERPQPMKDATVHIRGDQIASISSATSFGIKSLEERRSKRNVEIIDGHGLYLIPGLIDSHVHTSDLTGIDNSHAPTREEIAAEIRMQTPRSYLFFGYTTLIDLITTPEQITAWNSYEAHPDLYFCGGAQIPGGYPPIQFVSAEDRRSLTRYMLVERGEEGKAPQGMDPVAHTPEAVVARMKQDGALCVKTFYERGFGEVDELPAPRLDTIRDLVKAAHAAHMPVLIHANGTDAQEFAVKAGTDIIAHGLWHWNREQDATELTPRAKVILDSVLKAKMGWQPTMQVLYGLQDLFDPGYLSQPSIALVVPASAIEWYESPQGQWFHDSLAPAFLPNPVKESHDRSAQWNAARASIAPPIARDRNATRYMAAHGARILFGTDTPSSPTYANPPGLNGWHEMQHMLDAGMTPLQIFQAATIANAEAFGLDREIGTIQVGKRANLLLLRQNPTLTINAYNDIIKVILRGRVIDRANLAAKNITDGVGPGAR